MKNELPRVEIVWRDIVESAGLTSRDDVMKVEPEMCSSIGYLLDITDDVVRIVSSTVNTPKELYYHVLSRGVVKSIHRLRRDREIKP